MRSQNRTRANKRKPTQQLNRPKKIATRSIMTDSEEDEFDDTLLQQIDDLLGSITPQKTTPPEKSPEDKFFDELVDILKATDRESQRLVPVVDIDDDEIFNSKDYFDEILKDIPKSERINLHQHDNKTEEEIAVEVDELITDIEKQNAKSAYASKKAAYLKKIELEIAEPKYIDACLIHRKGIETQHESDLRRIQSHTDAIVILIKQLPTWSPAKNAYNKILRDKTLTHYDKLQQLVQTANDIVEKSSQTQKGFLVTRLTRNADRIHQAIAGIDINADSRQELKSTARMTKPGSL